MAALPRQVAVAYTTTSSIRCCGVSLRSQRSCMHVSENGRCLTPGQVLVTAAQKSIFVSGGRDVGHAVARGHAANCTSFMTLVTNCAMQAGMQARGSSSLCRCHGLLVHLREGPHLKGWCAGSAGVRGVQAPGVHAPDGGSERLAVTSCGSPSLCASHTAPAN